MNYASAHILSKFEFVTYFYAMSLSASPRVCFLFGFLCEDEPSDRVIDEQEQRNIKDELTTTMQPLSWDSDLPSDSPSLMPSSILSSIPSDVPSSLPSDAASHMPSDVPSLVPSGIWSVPAIHPPTTSPASDGMFPSESPVDGSVFPFSVDQSSLFPTTVPKRDVSEIADGEDSVNYTTQTNDTLVVTLLAVVIVVCSLAIAAVALFIIAQKAKQRRDHGIRSLSGSRSRDCDGSDDNAEGHVSFTVNRAESVSSLSSAWREDLNDDFAVLQNLGYPASTLHQADGDPELYACPIDILASGMGRSKGDRIDRLKYLPQNTVNDTLENATNRLDERASKESGAQMRFARENDRDLLSIPRADHRSEPMNRMDACAATCSGLAGQFSVCSPAEGNGSFSESSATLNPFDQLTEEYEMELDQWRQFGEI